MNKEYENLTKKEIIQYRKEIMKNNESLKKRSVILMFSSVFIVVIPGQLFFADYKYSFITMCILTYLLAYIAFNMFLYPQLTEIIKQNLKKENT